MKRLILSTIPDDFNPDTDIPFSPSCFLGKEHIFPNWESLSYLEEPFPSQEAVLAESEKTSLYANQCLPNLISYLNQEHGATYPPSFWRLLLMPWVLVFIQTCWERQARINKLLARYGHEAISVTLLSSDITWHFIDTCDFNCSGVLNPVYNFWLLSRLIENKIPELWEVNYVNGEQENLSQATVHRSLWREKIKAVIYPHIRCKGVYGFSPYESLFFSFLLLFKRKKNNDAEFNQQVAMAESEPICLTWNTDIFNLMKTSIPHCFKHNRNGIIPLNAKKYKHIKFKPRQHYHLIGPVLYYGEKLKYQLAQSLLAGDRLIVTQHGSSYGTTNFSPLKKEIEYVHEAFFSWGWQKQGDLIESSVALPSPLLSKFAKRYDKSQKKYLYILVGTLPLLFNRGFEEQIGPNQVISYMQDKRSFLQGLEDSIAKKFVYRPYYDLTGAISDEKYMRTHFPNLPILTGVLQEHLVHCALLVMDHPGTTMNIALAANMPIVCFWPKKTWSVCQEAKHYFDWLEAVGIYHETPQKAAKHISQLGDDLQTWWQSGSVQQAVQAWAYQYARTSPHWMKEWIKALWKL